MPPARSSARRIVATSVAIPVTLSVTVLGLIAPPSADAALTDASVTATANLHDDAKCTVTPDPSEGVTRALAANGRSVTVVDRRAATATAADPGDRVELSGIATGTTTVSPVTSAGGTIRFVASGTASVAPRLATSACDAHASVGVDAFGKLVLPGPMWATATLTSAHDAYAEVRATGAIDEIHSSSLGPGRSSSTHRFPAGTVEFETLAAVDSYQGDGRLSGSAAITISFRPVGAAGAVSGAGRRFVVPGGRSCASDTVGVTLTRAVRRAKRVEIRVNGVRRFKASGHRIKPRTVAFGVAATAPATVTALIKPKKGKRVTVTRSYLACD